MYVACTLSIDTDMDINYKYKHGYRCGMTYVQIWNNHIKEGLIEEGQRARLGNSDIFTTGLHLLVGFESWF